MQNLSHINRPCFTQPIPSYSHQRSLAHTNINTASLRNICFFSLIHLQYPHAHILITDILPRTSQCTFKHLSLSRNIHRYYMENYTNVMNMHTITIYIPLCFLALSFPLWSLTPLLYFLHSIPPEALQSLLFSSQSISNSSLYKSGDHARQWSSAFAVFFVFSALLSSECTSFYLCLPRCIWFFV